MKYLFALFVAVMSTVVCAQQIDTSGLRRSGQFILNSNGQPLHIHGVNRFDPTLCDNPTNSAHTQPNGVPVNREPAHQIRQRDQWHINAVRIMINEWCWQKNEVKEGKTYKEAIAQLVTSLTTSSNMIAIISLAIVQSPYDPNTRPPNNYGNQNLSMPNVHSSLPIWREIAQIYKTNTRVIFNLYNEPTPYLCSSSGSLPFCNGNYLFDEAKAFDCLRNGRSACTGNGNANGVTVPPPPMGANAVGMQELLTAIRQEGAKNFITLPGINYSTVHRHPVTYTDPENNYGFGMHGYRFSTTDVFTCGNPPTEAGCHAVLDAALTRNGAFLGTTYPLIFEEFGTTTPGDTDENGTYCNEQLYVPAVVNYMRAKKHGYMFHSGWQKPSSGSNGSCSNDNFYAFQDITASTLAPTRYGRLYKDLVAQQPSWSYAAITPTAITLLQIGDSLTDGGGTNESSFPSFRGPTVQYLRSRGFTVTTVGPQERGTISGFSTKHAGYGGATTGPDASGNNIDSRLNAIKAAANAANATVITVLLGQNDVYNYGRVYQSFYVSRYRTLLERIATMWPSAKIVASVTTLPGYVDQTDRDTYFTPAHNSITAWAATNPARFRIADVRSVLTPGFNNGNRHFNETDNTHYTAAGATIVGNKFGENITALFGPVNPPPDDDQPPPTQIGAEGIDLIRNGCFMSAVNEWQFNTTVPADGHLQHVRQSDGKVIGMPFARVTVTTKGTLQFQAQMFQKNIGLVAGRDYKLKLFSRANHRRPMQVSIQVCTTGCTVIYTQTVTLTNTWPAFPIAIPFESTLTTATADVVFQVGQDVGTVDLGCVSLQ